MFKREREEIKNEKLNLVPIMDAVFIFIFFLLFSAQFIKLYEIETEAPIVSDSPSVERNDEDPLHLNIRIDRLKIQIYTEINKQLKKTYYLKDPKAFESLNSYLLTLRMANPEDRDNYAIITPNANVDYELIIKTVEAVQKLPTSEVYKVKLKNGKERVLTKIYSQVVLEPLDET